MNANVMREKRDPVKITLNDGIERELKFTLNALAELEDRYGSVEEAFAALDRNSIKAVRCLLYAGFLHYQGEEALTEQQVGEMLDIASLQEMTESLGLALEQDMPEVENPQLPAIGGTDPNA